MSKILKANSNSHTELGPSEDHWNAIQECIKKYLHGRENQQ